MATKDGKRRHEALRRGPSPGIRVADDAQGVFRSAIGAGVLSGEPADRSWAGHYLYMFHDEDGTAWFKHRDTRGYVSMGVGGFAHGGRP